MKVPTEVHRSFLTLLFLALFLACAPAAMAKVWYVDGVNGSDSNDCQSTTTACKTMGHAISLASSGDTIGVGPAIYTENLTISISLKIVGSDAATTIVDGGGTGTVFTISNLMANVLLSRLTIRNGVLERKGAGGVYNIGTLTINLSTITKNWVSLGAGGIYNSGTLTINSSTVSENETWDGGAGGLFNIGTLTITNSSISGNLAFQGRRDQFHHGNAGGIYDSGTLTITNSTIGGNTGQDGVTVGGIFEYGNLRLNNTTVAGNRSNYVGGIACGYGCTLQNSILAYNHGGWGTGNCETYGLTSLGYNLSTDDSCNLNGSGDMNGVKAKLGPLGNYGGPTQTIPLRWNSPAIDAGNPNGCTDSNGNLLKTDQRGKLRLGEGENGVCDIGAFERQNF